LAFYRIIVVGIFHSTLKTESILKMKKRVKVLIIVLSVIVVLFAVFWGVFGDFIKHMQPYRRGVEYYSDGSYSKFGFGFTRYGKIASKYLPKYEDVSKNATDVEFVYCGDGIYSKTVFTVVAAKYDAQTYISKRDEILKTGSDFGVDGFIGETETRYHRLIEKKQIHNGDYMYYVVSCCDKDNSIMYYVLFDAIERSDMVGLSMYNHTFYNFYREFHVECMPAN